MFRRLIGLVVLLALIGGAAALWVSRDWWGDGPLAAPVTVTVPQGATLASAARALEKAGVIRSTTSFLRLARRFGTPDPIRAGEFDFPARISGSEALDILQHGKPVQRLVTIPEGMPSILVQERLAAEPTLSGAAPLPAEGSVLPDSYSFEKNETRAAVLARMQQAMTKALDEEWDARKPTTVVKTKREALILASIVEKETALPSERRMVAAVYSNRVRLGMKLQADPTIIYPITHGKPLGRRIKQSEVHAINGYNTYAITGLPEGPIANPGRASIEAVLDPATSKALYFVANGKGGHVFAETLAQHNANVQRFYALRRARGEM
jgi:UPF0755 protein